MARAAMLSASTKVVIGSALAQPSGFQLVGLQWHVERAEHHALGLDLLQAPRSRALPGFKIDIVTFIPRLGACMTRAIERGAI